MGINSIQVKKITPLHDTILVTDMAFKERFTNGGIIVLNDDGRDLGIRPRWGKVYAIGPDQTDVTIGQWVCVAHGRWSRGIRIEDPDGEKTVRRIDNDDILLISDHPVVDDTIGIE